MNEQLWFHSAAWYYWGFSQLVSHTGERGSSWATDPLPTGPWVCSGCCARDISSSRLYLLILSPPCLTSCMYGAKNQRISVWLNLKVSYMFHRRKQGMRFFIHGPVIAQINAGKGFGQCRDALSPLSIAGGSVTAAVVTPAAERRQTKEPFHRREN